MEAVLRVVVIYLVVVIGLRVLGKREFGQLSPLELVTLLLIPEIVSSGIQGDHFSLTHAIVGVCTLFVLVFVTSLISARFQRFQTLLDGTPRVEHRSREPSASRLSHSGGRPSEAGGRERPMKPASRIMVKT